MLHLRTGPEDVAEERGARDALDDRRHAPHLLSHFGGLLGLDNHFGQVCQLFHSSGGHLFKR